MRRRSTGDSRPIRVAIVGGGVASVEIALRLQQQWRKSAVDRDYEIHLFCGSERVADELNGRSIDRVERLLQRRNIATHREQRVVEVTDTDLATKNGKRFPVDCVIWATGAAPPPVLKAVCLRTDDRGFIATSKTLRSLSDNRIFAVGDAGTILESPAPKAGVYAVRQSPILWNNLRALFSGGPMQVFEPQVSF